LEKDCFDIERVINCSVNVNVFGKNSERLDQKQEEEEADSPGYLWRKRGNLITIRKTGNPQPDPIEQKLCE
jgi:hypothetical protein